jgi:hypothetical protein
MYCRHSDHAAAIDKERASPAKASKDRPLPGQIQALYGVGVALEPVYANSAFTRESAAGGARTMADPDY